jgi:hypothetical protein
VGINVFCLTGRLQGFFERSNEMVHIANYEIANDELDAVYKNLQSEFIGEFTCIGLEGNLTLTFQIYGRSSPCVHAVWNDDNVRYAVYMTLDRMLVLVDSPDISPILVDMVNFFLDENCSKILKIAEIVVSEEPRWKKVLRVRNIELKFSTLSFLKKEGVEPSVPEEEAQPFTVFFVEAQKPPTPAETTCFESNSIVPHFPNDSVLRARFYNVIAKYPRLEEDYEKLNEFAFNVGEGKLVWLFSKQALAEYFGKQRDLQKWELIEDLFLIQKNDGKTEEAKDLKHSFSTNGNVFHKYSKDYLKILEVLGKYPPESK